MGASRRALHAAAATSPHARDGIFSNTESGRPRERTSIRTATRMILRRNENGVPHEPVQPATPHFPPRAAPLAVTWLGHACVLLEIDGRRVLVDPVWSERTSPVPLLGPRRLYPMPAPLSALPQVDLVLLTHDHYDHLDRRTVRALARDSSATFVAPVGVGEHLRAWGVPEQRVVTRDWGGRTEVGELALTCLEARHFSGRGLRRNTSQWAAWAVAGPQHRVYVGGDTGPTAAFARSGAAHGPFDLTVLPIGAYSDLWPDIHLDPEQAVSGHRDLRGDVLLPIHWATFNLGFHGWSEPGERLRRAADAAGVRLALPRPGERVDLAAPLHSAPWWSTPER
ncbi:MBL fold metallo-hydrolase [Pseudonocardia sp. KRD-291]|nr:MBL fold metallo-hydrolase [Pseudonocardia sp. KRD291]